MEAEKMDTESAFLHRREFGNILGVGFKKKKIAK